MKGQFEAEKQSSHSAGKRTIRNRRKCDNMTLVEPKCRCLEEAKLSISAPTPQSLRQHGGGGLRLRAPGGTARPPDRQSSAGRGRADKDRRFDDEVQLYHPTTATNDPDTDRSINVFPK